MKKFMQTILVLSTLITLPAFGMSRFSSFSKRLGSFAASKFGAFRTSFTRSIPKMRNFSNTAFRSPKSRFFKGIVGGAGFATACAGVQKVTEQESTTQVKEYANVDDLIHWKDEFPTLWNDLIKYGGAYSRQQINGLYKSIQKEVALTEEMNTKIANLDKKQPLARGYFYPFSYECIRIPYTKQEKEQQQKVQQEKESIRVSYQEKINQEKISQENLRNTLFQDSWERRNRKSKEYYNGRLDRMLEYLKFYDRARR